MIKKYNTYIQESLNESSLSDLLIGKKAILKDPRMALCRDGHFLSSGNEIGWSFFIASIRIINNKILICRSSTFDNKMSYDIDNFTIGTYDFESQLEKIKKEYIEKKELMKNKNIEIDPFGEEDWDDD